MPPLVLFQMQRPGDLWLLGRHRLYCGDARDANAYAALLGDEVVDLICTDPPYNVPIDGHVVIADNKLALNAGWDKELLAIELQGLLDLDFEIELTGFSLAEIDIVLDEARDSAPDGAEASVEDAIPAYRHDGVAVTPGGP
jgi:DNA modification methylase